MIFKILKDVFSAINNSPNQIVHLQLRPLAKIFNIILSGISILIFFSHPISSGRDGATFWPGAFELTCFLEALFDQFFTLAN